MKKIFMLMLVFTAMIICSVKTYAMSFEEAMKQPKPFAVFVYADWAEDVNKSKTAFEAMAGQQSSIYNFIMLDIASKDAKFFNKSYYIYPNLPYVLLYKDKGKVSRYLKSDCVNDSTCFADKLKYFIH